ncbi:MAG: hypothetical protein L6R42_005991 [Xanthoria sp. 1 TBL-2021]|nr:MAG: hypothetical protein L6R42_005991 [Xanthoria sp. 1 TBL-2021]
MAQEITLFDLPSNPPNKAWSYNPWKTRLILNYKSLPYKTHWLEFPDIAPHLSSLGIPPNAQGTPYTVPTIHLPPSDSHSKDEYIMDSKAIAIALEAKYPNPPLHLDVPQLARAEELWSQAIRALLGVFAPVVIRTMLTDRNKEYMEPKIDLESLVGGDEAWKGAKPVLQAIGVLLKEKGGPFVLGETVSYVDFILVSGMHAFKRAGIFERWVEIEPACGRLYDASKQWLERDDH